MTVRKKLMIAIELGENNGVKRACFKQIYDYSSEQLISIFESHISKQPSLLQING